MKLKMQMIDLDEYRLPNIDIAVQICLFAVGLDIDTQIIIAINGIKVFR